MTKRNRDKKKRMMRLAAKAPNWVRHVAATKAYPLYGQQQWRSPGTFGAASAVRHIVKDGKEIK